MAIDLGTGDGRFVAALARRESSTLAIGIDANADALAAASRKAPANALFVRAAVESLPAELKGLACAITVNFPWGSLFEAVLAADVDILASIAALCRPDATLTIIASVEPMRDAAMLERFASEPLSERHLLSLAGAYAAAGFRLTDLSSINPAAMRSLGTTWAKKLAANPERTSVRIAFEFAGADG